MSETGELSQRQEAFCHAYLKLGSAAAGARDAGYSGASAKSQGWRLLQEPRVRVRLEALRAAGVTGIGAGRTGRYDAAALLAKLESVYEDARARKDFRAAVRAIEAQARMLERFGALASDHDANGPLPPLDEEDSADSRKGTDTQEPPHRDKSAAEEPLDAPTTREDDWDYGRAVPLPFAAVGENVTGGQQAHWPGSTWVRIALDLWRPGFTCKLRQIAADMRDQHLEKWAKKRATPPLRPVAC